MKTTVKLLMVGLLLGSITMGSCSKDGIVGPQGPQGEQGIPGQDGIDGAAANQGEQGPAGPEGPQGPAGPQGTNGQDGADGQNGQNGTNGTNGLDGNANVRSFLFDISDKSGLNFEIAVPEFTSSVLNDDVILWYVKNNNLLYPVPGSGPNANFVSRVFARIGFTRISFHNWDGTSYSLTAGELEELRIVIIESSSTTSGKSSGKQSVFDELEAAGVNIENYEEVLNYYNLKD